MRRDEPRIAHGIGAKEYPGKGDQGERYGDLDEPGDTRHQREERGDGLSADQIQAVQNPPDNECPIGSVPKTADDEGDHQVDVVPGALDPASAERDIYVIAKP